MSRLPLLATILLTLAIGARAQEGIVTDGDSFPLNYSLDGDYAKFTMETAKRQEDANPGAVDSLQDNSDLLQRRSGRKALGDRRGHR